MVMHWLLKRRWLWAVSFLGLVGFGAGCLFYVGVLGWRQRPTMAEYGLVEYGMDQAQVEAIMGPPRRVLTADSKNLSGHEKLYKLYPDEEGKIAYYYEGRLEQGGKMVRSFGVEFNEDGKVCCKGSGSLPNYRYPFRLRRWLRWLLGD
jgi:hypothetical protein